MGTPIIAEPTSKFHRRFKAIWCRRVLGLMDPSIATDVGQAIGKPRLVAELVVYQNLRLCLFHPVCGGLGAEKHDGLYSESGGYAAWHGGYPPGPRPRKVR